MRLIQTIDNDEFYPTPATLVKRMLAGIDWNMVQTVLESSGDAKNAWRFCCLPAQCRNYPESVYSNQKRTGSPVE